MNTFTKYFLILAGVAALGFVLWYFSSIVIYILVAAVLSLIGGPLVDLLTRIRYRRIVVPRWLAAMVTLILLWILVIAFFRVFIPLIASEANDLSHIDSETVMEKLATPMQKVERIYNEYFAAQNNDLSLEDYINDKIKSVLKISIVSNIFSYIFGLLDRKSTRLNSSHHG